MLKSKKNDFSLYSWLLKKLQKRLLLWYLLTFVSLYFYYQTTSYGLKQLWGYEKAELPFKIFFWEINSRAVFICYLLSAFFLIYLLISIFGEYLKNYSLELCRFHLRKLILVCSQKSPKKAKEYQKEILNNFFTEAELFTPIFILVPQRIFSAIISIILSFFFLSGLRRGNDSFTTYFILILSLILITLIYFFYQIQSKIYQKESKFRRQENALFEEYLQKQKDPQRVEKEIDKNFYQIRYSFWKKAFSALSYLIIPGFGILYCFIFSAWRNFKVEEFVEIAAIAGSLQTIFFKIKDIVDNLPSISKGKIYYQTLAKSLKNLEINS